MSDAHCLDVKSKAARREKKLTDEKEKLAKKLARLRAKQEALVARAYEDVMVRYKALEEYMEEQSMNCVGAFEDDFRSFHEKLEEKYSTHEFETVTTHEASASDVGSDNNEDDDDAP
ncbi:hypothetical protein CFOL_v3_32435 [Cephalotus follicularis]|uniref:Uncharacterized protein n=1 Tax=Cephalotus follicularis TaxID=3775 RepID=A0A1Q3D964_CEPFO|nr:hypothetical protein CFOL_v3_32435 [Cephalotus follicularis]